MLGDGRLKEKIKEIFKNSIIRRYILFGVAIVCIVLMGIGAFNMISIQHAYRQSANLNEELAQFLSFDPVDRGNNQEVEDVEEGETEETFTLPAGVELPAVDFDSLREINPNVIGWIILEGTPMNLPVVQGDDNIFYLNHLFDGRSNASGAIFLDYINSPDFTDPHTIIYGHHMHDGSMFASVEQYQFQDFYEEHQLIFLLTPERDYVIKPFAGYLANPHTDDSWRLEFENESDKNNWIDGRRERSNFESNTQVDGSQRFVTLSTCSNRVIDTRYVVVGRLMPIAR
jgi:sortase B